MNTASACPRCHQTLPQLDLGVSQPRCPTCALDFAALAIPAPPTIPIELPQTALGEAATCFFHEESAATTGCARCGRFLCPVCEISLDGESLCPACFQAARAGGQLASLRQRDTLYDSMALAAGWGWMLFYPAWLFALPAVIYWTTAKWRAPDNYLVPRGRWRYALAMLGLLVVPVAFVFFFGLWIGMRRALAR